MSIHINFHYLARKGFSLAEVLISMLIVGVIFMASVSLMSMQLSEKTGLDINVSNCVVKEGAADLTSAACLNAIETCKSKRKYGCDTLSKYVEDAGNSDAALTVLKETCDQGGERACDILADRCIEDSSNCDISGKDYDVRNYLALAATSTNKGKLYLFNRLKQDFEDEISPVVDEVVTTCASDASSMACKVLENKTYNFDLKDRGDFIEEDSVEGTYFVDGVVKLMLIPPGPDEWIYQYGDDSGYVKFNDFTLSGDYLYITGSEQIDPDGGEDDITVMKLNTSDGSIVWLNQYGGADSSFTAPGGDAGRIIEESGDYLYVCGYQQSDTSTGIGVGSSSAGNAYIMKLNKSDGSVVWKNKYGTMNSTSFYSIKVSGGNIYATGSVSHNNQLIFVMKVNDSDGSRAWAKEYGDDVNAYEYPYELEVDNGYIYVIGKESDIDKDAGGPSESFLMKLDETDGTIEWLNQYDFGISIEVSGNYIYMAGEQYENPNGYGYQDIFIMKLNISDGSKEWHKLYGTEFKEYFNNITLLDDDLYIIGMTYQNPEGSKAHDELILKVDASNGSTEWARLYGGTGSDVRLGYASISVDGSYLYTMGSEGSDTDGGNTYIKKIDINKRSNLNNWSSGNEATGWSLEGDGPLTSVADDPNDTEVIDEWPVLGAEVIPWTGVTNFPRPSPEWYFDAGSPLTCPGDIECIKEGTGYWTLEGDGPIPLYGDPDCGTSGNEECIDEWGIYREIVDEWIYGFQKMKSYVTTSNANQISDATKIVKISITENTPTNTSIGWLVSFDGRSTWETITADQNEATCSGTQVTTDISTYYFDGSSSTSSSDLIAYLRNCTLPNGTLDLAFNLLTTDTSVTPYVDEVVITYY